MYREGERKLTRIQKWKERETKNELKWREKRRKEKQINDGNRLHPFYHFSPSLLSFFLLTLMRNFSFFHCHNNSFFSLFFLWTFLHGKNFSLPSFTRQDILFLPISFLFVFSRWKTERRRKKEREGKVKREREREGKMIKSRVEMEGEMKNHQQVWKKAKEKSK